MSVDHGGPARRSGDVEEHVVVNHGRNVNRKIWSESEHPKARDKWRVERGPIDNRCEWMSEEGLGP